MILIGERINTGFKDIKAAVADKNGQAIKDWAQKQTQAKATYLDVNLGPASNKVEDLIWMIEQVQEAVDTPISIDNNKPAMIKEAIKVCKKPPLINSTTAVEEQMNELMGLAKEYDARIIGLCMDETGSPKALDQRMEIAGMLMAKAMEIGLDSDQLCIDPIAMPLKYMQEQLKDILEAARNFQLLSDPPCHIVCGLSNIANGTKHKALINRTFCTMAIANGLDAVICDVTDSDLIDAVLTAELIMNRGIYADSYLEAFKNF
jgi:5-methyltetrahydrofolate corrinoid/iron sulfur protein methyltransferase